MTKNIIDTCDFCGTSYPPLGSVTVCGTCGAPRAKWESYRPAIVSDDYVLTRKGMVFSSSAHPVIPGEIYRTMIQVPYPVSIEEITFVACGLPQDLLTIHSVTIGVMQYLGSPARLGRLVLANLRTILRDRILLPSIPLYSSIENASGGALNVETIVVAAPLGSKWEEFVKANS